MAGCLCQIYPEQKVMASRASKYGSRLWFLESVLAAVKAREMRLSFLRRGLWLVGVSSNSRPAGDARQSPAFPAAPPLSTENPPTTCVPASYFATKEKEICPFLLAKPAVGCRAPSRVCS